MKERLKKLEETIDSMLDFIAQKKLNENTPISSNKISPNSYYINKDNNSVCFVKSVSVKTLIKYDAIDKRDSKYHVISGGSSVESFNNAYTRPIDRKEYESWLNKASECFESDIS